MIEVKHVSKSFDGTLVLKDISVVFEAGKTNMIIGQSGSGKTVLMKSVIGLHKIDQGRIEYDGRNLPDMKMKDIRKLRKEVGMLCFFTERVNTDNPVVNDDVLSVLVALLFCSAIEHTFFSESALVLMYV